MIQLEENEQEEAIKKQEHLKLGELNIEELIDKVKHLSLTTNPYSVSKEIEAIKSIFYNKLKLLKIFYSFKLKQNVRSTRKNR